MVETVIDIGQPELRRDLEMGQPGLLARAGTSHQHEG